MLHKLINHSPDLKRLAEDGYEMEVNGSYLLVHHIPYVNEAREVKLGTLVAALSLASPEITAKPPDHTAYFQGDKPCDSSGNPLMSIINSSGTKQLTSTLKTNHYFSSKPKTGNYPDYYEKIRTYAEILCSQAKVIDASATSRPFRKPVSSGGNEIFNYPDTNSARASIEALNGRFYDLRVAILGMGGTGSYILDLVSKTPVKEIHLYDADDFQVHNAFRAPGATSSDKFGEKGTVKKVDYFYSIYSQMHKGIHPHAVYVDVINIQELAEMDYVFIAVDNNEARHFIATELLKLGKPFIDVGLGVHIVDDSLLGIVRVTSFSKDRNDHLNDRIGRAQSEINEYAPNIQIADLNCLNAVMAVVKWKKMVGFYQDLKKEHNSLYIVNTGKIINDDIAA